MAVLFPQPPPLKTPLFDPRGELTEEWRRFFLTLQGAITTLITNSITLVQGGGPGVGLLLDGTGDAFDSGGFGFGVPPIVLVPTQVVFGSGSGWLAQDPGLTYTTASGLIANKNLGGLFVGPDTIPTDLIGTGSLQLTCQSQPLGVQNGIPGNFGTAFGAVFTLTTTGLADLVIAEHYFDTHLNVHHNLSQYFAFDFSDFPVIDSGKTLSTHTHFSAATIASGPGTITNLFSFSAADVVLTDTKVTTGVGLLVGPPSLNGAATCGSWHAIECQDLVGDGVTGDNHVLNYASGRMVIDSAGKILTAGLTITGFTLGSIPYITTGGAFAQDNAHLFWDATNKRVGIGTASPGALLDAQSGTITTSVPALHLSQTWNAAGVTFVGVQWDFTDSNSASLTKFLTITKGGQDFVRITKDGQLINGDIQGAGNYMSTGGNGFTYRNSNAAKVSMGFDTVAHITGIELANDCFLYFDSTNNVDNQTPDVALTRNAAGVIEINNKTAGTFRDLKLRNEILTGTITTYNNVTTAGGGVPAIYGSGRSTGQTGAVASVAAYMVGASDGSFWVSMNILITAFTAGTISGVVTYTSEDGTARSLTLNFSSLAGVLGTTAGAAGAFEGVPLHIRAKASTAITCTTTVSVFTGTYNVEGTITQIA